MMAPYAEEKAVKGLVLSGQAFTAFDQHERAAIWERLQTFTGLVPSLYSFFEDFKCFENWAHCLTRLFTLRKPTMRETMANLRTWSDDNEILPVQTTDSTFASRVEPVERQFDLAYRQMWLFVMRYYPQMPREPKRQNRLAKPANATADECVVFNMACLASRLGFHSDEITELSSRCPDRLIALRTLQQARKPGLFEYDESILESLIDTIVRCFSVARRKDIITSPVMMSLAPKQKARCGHPSMPSLQQDRPRLFLDDMHATEQPDRVTSFFVRRCVYWAFFGPRPTLSGGATNDGQPTLDTAYHPPNAPNSPLFIRQDDGFGRNGDENLFETTQNDEHGAVEQQSQFRRLDEQWLLPMNATTIPISDSGELQHRNEQSAYAPMAELEAEGQQCSQQGMEQQARDHQVADNTRLQAQKDEMARGVQVAEERIANQAAELERLQREATSRTAIGTSVPQHDEPMEYTSKVGEGQMELTVSSNAEQEGGLDQIITEPEDVPLLPEIDDVSGGLSRPVTQFDMANLLVRWRDRASHLDGEKVPLVRSPREDIGKQKRRSKPAGIKISRAKGRQTKRAANRLAARTRAIYNDQKGELDVYRSTVHPSNMESQTEETPATQNLEEERGKPGADRAVDALTQESRMENRPATKFTLTTVKEGRAGSSTNTNHLLVPSNDVSSVGAEGCRQSLFDGIQEAQNLRQLETSENVTRASSGHEGEAESLGREAPISQRKTQGGQQTSQLNDGKWTQKGGQGNDVDLESPLDEILQNDAEQRAMGEQVAFGHAQSQADSSNNDEIPRPEKDEGVERERAAALTQLQGLTTDAPLPSETRTHHAELSRPVTRLDVQDLLVKWRERARRRERASLLDTAHPDGSNRMRKNYRRPSSKPAGFSKTRINSKLMHKSAVSGAATINNQVQQGVQSFDEAALATDAHLLPVSGVKDIANRPKSLEAGVAQRKRKRQRETMTKAKKIQKTETSQPLRLSAVESGLGASQAESVMAPSEAAIPSRQVRFDTSINGIEPAHIDTELAQTSELTRDLATPRELRPRPVTRYDFREMARNARRSPAAENGGGFSGYKISITFYLYEHDEWKVANVLRIDPSRPAELVREARRYTQKGMILLDMKMKTVGVRSSFQAATAEGTNTLLLVSRETKRQMGGMLPEPPAIARGQQK